MAHMHASGNRMEKLKRNKKRLSIVFSITLGFAFVEVAGGIASSSLALISDAGHMFIDSAAIALSLFAVHLSLKPASARNTYSLARIEVIAAFFNGVTLVGIAFYIFYEAYKRIENPPDVEAGILLVVAGLGLGINILAAYILWDDSHDNLNIRGALLHIMGDILGSVGAIVAGLVIALTGWNPADAIISILIGLLIIRSSWILLKDSFHVLMEGTPPGIDADEIMEEIKSVKEVRHVHDFHVWSLTTGVILLTAHVGIDDLEKGPEVLRKITRLLCKEYGIDHTTIQIEDADINCQVSC